MSFLSVSPESVAAAAGDLSRLGTTVGAANAAAAVSTTEVLAAGADEVSTRIAALFGGHGLEYQSVSAQVAQFHDHFVQTMRAGAGSYLWTEAENAEQNLLNVINAPTQTLLGRPLIGNGANATTPGGKAGPVGCCTATAAAARPAR